MSSRHPRKSLEGVFGEMEITGLGSQSTSLQQEVPRTVLQSLTNSIRSKGFPCWSTLKWSNAARDAPMRRDFSMTMSNDYVSYDTRAELSDPKQTFKEASELVAQIKATLSKAAAQEDVMNMYANFTAETMALMIFGSNMKEDAGASHAETYRICMRIFDGEDVDAAAVQPRTREYEDVIRFLKQERRIQDPSEDDVIRSRREIIQHAKALKHLTDVALNRDQPLTEELILETHAILSAGEHFAGKYRTRFVKAGTLVPPDHPLVPGCMKKFVVDFNDDVKSREQSGDMDPFYLAADICQDFVTIHPFEDGNGRMCRILLNAYLIKYAGVMVSIGESEEDRQSYDMIAAEAGDGDTEEMARGKLANMVLQKATATLRRLREKLGKQ